MIKLNLGSCDLPLDGWINVDNSTSPHIKCDLIADALNLSEHFESNSVDEIYAGHLVEHLTPTEADAAFTHWKSLLKPGGILGFVTPDFHHLAQEYLAGGIPMEDMNNIYIFSYVQESHHRSIWDQESQFKMLQKHSFTNIKPIDRIKDERLSYAVEWQVGSQGQK
jgi:predicted SAM-dependent methyltransferase